MQNQGFTNLMSRRKELSDRNKSINFYLQKWGGGNQTILTSSFFICSMFFSNSDMC
jgi:hypothetical protein